MIVVAALIVREEDGRLLIAQRPAHLSSPGRWEFPGGKVEQGEDPRHALVRECREELAIAIEAGAVYETIFVPRSERDLLLLFYRARILAGQPTPQEANPVAWVDAREIRQYDILASDLPLLDTIERHWPAFLRL